jgi:phenylalanyl-tRNA synthetase beta chain
MPSEACVRFERGISAELTLPALKRATKLIIELCGGQAAQGIIDVYPGKVERKPIRITTAETKRLLGIEFTVDEITETLTALGFECQPSAATSNVVVKAPYWRSDINLPVDVIEEVARIRGYDKIPTTLLAQPIPKQNPAPITALKRNIRNMMVGYGFQEVVNYALSGMDVLARLNPQNRKPDPLPVRLANPMTTEQEYLRPTLRANLLTALANNKAFLDDGLRLFELGKIYLPKEASLPEEPDVFCAVVGGQRNERWWQGDSGPFDFTDARGIADGLLNQLGIKARYELAADETLHPLYQASILVQGQQIGLVGELHPAVAGHFELSGNVYLLELNLPVLLPLIGQRIYTPVPKFPATIRDIALVVDIKVTHQQIVDIIKAVSLVTDVKLFDVYVGEQVPAGKKSLAYRITYQSPNRTLTDEEVKKVQQQILKRLTSDVGAVLRS